MTRGSVFSARLDPTEGSEQSGARPVVIVSRDAINDASPVVIVVPCTTRRPGRRVYPSQVEIPAGEGGLRADSIAMAEQVRAISKRRLVREMGLLSGPIMEALDRALLIAMDLPGSA